MDAYEKCIGKHESIGVTKEKLETTRDEIRNKLEMFGHRITLCHVKRSIAFQSFCVSGSLVTTTTSNCVSG